MVIVKTFLKNIATLVVMVYTTNEVIVLELGEKIRTMRKLRKLTQVDVAQKAKIAVNSLRLYEAGKRTPNLEQLKSIATAMDSSLADFLDDEKQKIFYAGADEGSDVENWVKKTLYGYSFSNTEGCLIGAFSRLNSTGQQEAVKRVEELTEIPRYRAETAPQDTPAPQEGKDTTQPPEGTEGPQEGE